LKSDFTIALLKKIRTSLEEGKKKITRETASEFDKKLLTYLMEIGEKIFAIKTGFFDVATGEKELEVEFNQKNNFLRLEIELRSYLFMKYKESLAEIAELLSSKTFAVVSFLPLFIQIPDGAENHLTMQQYLLFAYIMQRNLNNEPCKETPEEIARGIMLSIDDISIALKDMQERRFVLNLDRSGSNRLYINAPKLLKIKNEIYGAVENH
jgi:DNA-binding MarR family transcriptional regulator